MSVTWIISVIIMILLISVLILVHEAGHFLAAKMFKMKVSKFGFGLPIGPTLWKKKFGDLEVLVHAFLFGGYIAFPDDDKELNLPADSPDRFLNRPMYQRFVVYSAGVVANVICAIVFVMFTAIVWGQMPSGKYNVYVKSIVAEKQESVWQSGLQEGDKIIKINDSLVTNPNTLVSYCQLSKKFDGKVAKDEVLHNLELIEKLNPKVEKDGVIPKDTTVKLPASMPEQPVKLNDNILIGLEKYKNPKIDLSVSQQTLRDTLVGKSEVKVDGNTTLEDIATAFTDGEQPVNIVVERKGEIINLKPVYPNKDGMIGIMMSIEEIMMPAKGVKAIVKSSFNYLLDNTTMMIKGLYQIFSGKVPVSDLHGVIVITKIGGDVIQHNGFFSGLLLTAIISMNLAIINALPIPALDGGHVMFLIIEKIRGKRLDEKTFEKIVTFFFLLLVGLILLICFNDVYALITKKL